MTYPLGNPRHITLHWTAGDHTQTFDDYHFCIQGDGTIVKTLPITERGAHTWQRNTGNVGIAFCAMLDGYPVTPVQIERMAKLCAEVCIRFGIDPTGTISLIQYRDQGDALEDTGRMIDAPTVTDHCWFAKADGYYPARWDIGELLPTVLQKLAWYREKLEANLIPFETMK